MGPKFKGPNFRGSFFVAAFVGQFLWVIFRGSIFVGLNFRGSQFLWVIFRGSFFVGDLSLVNLRGYKEQ